MMVGGAGRADKAVLAAGDNPSALGLQERRDRLQALPGQPGARLALS
jgi:hypothetical protein